MLTKKWLDYCVNLILGGLTSFSLIYAMTTSLNFTSTPFEILAIVFLLLVIFSFAFYNSTTAKISVALALLIVLAGAVYLILKGLLKRFILTLYLPFQWVFNYINTIEPYDAAYEPYICIFLCVILTLAVFIFAIKRFDFFILLAGGFAVFVSQWILNYFASYIAFYLFLFNIIVYYLKYVYLRKCAHEPNEYIGQGQFTVLVAPFCIIIILISLAFPAKNKPLEWNWLDKRIEDVFNYFNSRYNYQVFDYFSIASTGFGRSNDRLGGKVKLDRTTVLKVESSSDIYLTGAIRDFYTGHSWINSDGEAKETLPSEIEDPFFDTFEMTEGFNLISLDGDYPRELLHTGKITVTYMNLKTRSMFYPLKLRNVILPEKSPINLLFDAESGLSADKMLGKNFEYSIEFYDKTHSGEELENALRRSRKGLYEDILSERSLKGLYEDALFGRSLSGRRNLRNATSKYTEYDSLILLAENAKAVYSKYVQLPETLPQRVKDLALTITEGLDNNYDKVKAIEAYLSANYPYTLNPKPTPRNADFVDYFLFESREGYCTYYASAMTILVRCLGIPARYVEGYMLPPKPESDNTYYITNQQAHAWTEVYFEGFGWLAFEPTSPFRANFYENSSSVGSISADFAYDPYYMEYMRMLEAYIGSNIDLENLDLGQGTDSIAHTLIIAIVVIAAIMLLVMAIMGIVLANAIRHKLRLKGFFKSPPRECVLSIYKYLVNILMLQGLGIKPGETPVQYSERIDRYLFFRSGSFREVTDIFMLARYSTKDLKDEQKQVLCDFIQPFLGEIRSDMGKFKFWVHKNILGKI